MCPVVFQGDGNHSLVAFANVHEALDAAFFECRLGPQAHSAQVLNVRIFTLTECDEALVLLGQRRDFLLLLLAVFHRHGQAVVLEHLGELDVARQVLAYIFFGLALEGFFE